MGLDATVYKNKRHFLTEAGELDTDLLCDEETGQVYPKEETNPKTGEIHPREEAFRKYPDRHAYIAKHVRIGNVAAIGQLKYALLCIGVPKDSVMQSKVLYSGSHCGDMLVAEDIEKLDKELDSIDSLLSMNRNKLEEQEDEKWIVGFREDMKELIRAAREEGNPIVF